MDSNPYWEVEPHFWHYSQIKFFSLFKTFYENKMSVEDCKSAMYGEFIKEGKPILSGFIQNLNLMVRLTKEIINAP